MKDKMCSEENPESLDFLFDKDYKIAEDEGQNAPWLCNENLQKSFKEELFADEIPINFKSEYTDFNVEQLLGSCFDENDFGSSMGSLGAPDSSRFISASMSLKEEDFESLNDLVSLPFDAVMESLEPCFEAASDSGLSTSDNAADLMLSPSSGTISPDHMADMSIDSMDNSSDVSSTSDLGSMVSVQGSPSRNGTEMTPSQMDLGNQVTYNNNISAPSLFAPNNSESVKRQNLSPISPLNVTSCRPIVAPKQSISNTPTVNINNVTRVTPLPHSTQITNSLPSIATRTIKLDLTQQKAISAAHTNVTNRPILKRVKLESSTTASFNTNSKTNSNINSSSTIVVTQPGKGNPILKNGTLLRTGNGKSILLPVNVKDLNQVRTIKIINPNLNNGSNRSATTGIRTLVSSVRPVSSSSSLLSTGNRTFYTTSKGSDGRSLFKVTPTAFVSPNQHNEQLRVGPASRIIKDEPSDDDDDDEDDDDGDEVVPKPNQKLILTDEERKLMRKEGLVLPSRYPLTKQEERDLKRIRRKIRNKISAQDSRKRKKEYVDGLEDRVKNCTEENKDLQNKIKHLEKQNESLVSQVKKFQSAFGTGLYTTRTNNHTSTALMMLILSAALFVVPSLRSQNGKAENEFVRSNKMPSAGHSRSLLEAKAASMNLQNAVEEFAMIDDETINDSLDFTPALGDHDYAPAGKRMRFDQSGSFAPYNTDKSLSRETGDPPDGGTIGMKTFMDLLGRLVNPLSGLGGNWTDPGGFRSGSNNATPPHANQKQSSVIVNLERKRMQDIELE